MADGPRDPYLLMDTPFGQVGQVALYFDTLKHLPFGRLVTGWLEKTRQALSSPTAICEGTTTPGYLVFVDHTETSPGSNSPWAVIVDPLGNPMPAVASIGYRRDFRDLLGHKVLWQPPSSS
jgi:hypothetical protein